METVWYLRGPSAAATSARLSAGMALSPASTLIEAVPSHSRQSRSCSESVNPKVSMNSDSAPRLSSLPVSALAMVSLS